MSFLTSAQMVNQNNRRLQRKGKAAFQHKCLPIMSKRTKEILEPVSPLVAHEFRARTESDRKRMQMATGLLLIIMLGISAAVVLALLGMM